MGPQKLHAARDSSAGRGTGKDRGGAPRETCAWVAVLAHGIRMSLLCGVRGRRDNGAIRSSVFTGGARTAVENVMLRELIDTSLQEDFVAGLAGTTGLRLCTYDSRGRVITSSPGRSEWSRLADSLPASLPHNLHYTPLPADEPPARVAFFESHHAWYILAPVHVDADLVGYLGVGEFREQRDDGDPGPFPADPAGGDAERAAAWRALPLLRRTGDDWAVKIARWAARMLSDRCQREARVHSASEQTALIGDIAELVTGGSRLQAILDRIVAETARVMKCPLCALRLYDPKTGELKMTAGYQLSAAYTNKGPVFRASSPVDDEALTGRVVYIEDVRDDPRVFYRDNMVREGIVSLLTAGVLYRGQPIGVLRVYTKQRQRFRRVQVNLLRAVAAQAAIAIANARLLEERLRAAVTERQLALAGEVQARMMSVAPPRHPALEIASAFLPSSHVGGDFCDVFELLDGRIAAVVADVVGKGIPAALLTASIRGALRATTECVSDLGVMLTRLNRHVLRETKSSEFATLLIIAIDPAQRRLSYASAGHDPLLLLRQGEVQTLAEGSLVLGIGAEVYQEYTLPLEPGDFLLLYTDGAIDAMNFAGDMFGRRQLTESVAACAGFPAQQALNSILWDVRRFIGLADQSDDLTLIAVRYIG